MEKIILLIDDDQDELEIFEEAVKPLPATISCKQALDLDEALDMLKAFTPDYIFIDYNIPLTNGLECLKELKALSLPANVKFIIYSNFIDEKTYTQAVALGAFCCMKKPSLTSELTENLKNILIN